MPPPLVKKPVPPAPAFLETNIEPIQPSSVIVIHPGSMYLRIGRASEAFPKVVPHVIARRNKMGPSPIRKDPYLVPLVSMSPELIASLNEIQNAITTVLASCLTRENKMRYSVPLNVVTEHNLKVRPQVVPGGKGDIVWVKVEDSQEFFIGEEALNLNPVENFNIHWPIRRGQLNLYSGIGGTLTSVLCDLETIWSAALKKYLGINPQELKSYRAVLVIPDVYKREHVKELVNLLLIRLGFMSCFVHLESVCATFGAGLSYACVVDVGDQKTTVSCVEDGISHRNTRLTINYGGSDITRLFHWLQSKLSFPYHCAPELPMDAIMMQELKEKLCHVNLDICGVQDRSFLVKRPSQAVVRYVIKVGDECLIAPLSLFHPEMFGITGPKKVRTMGRNEGMPEDPFDELYLLQTQRKSGKDTAECASEQVFSEETPMSSSIMEDDVDSTDPPANITMKEADQDLNFDHVLGIDQAIVQSIERCDCDEVKAKMYNCVLMVGGGMMFQGIHTWLRNRLKVQIPIMFRSEQLDIITKPKDMDPRVTVWKGAAIMSCFDTAQELWIKQKEWSKYSVRVLREKAPFTW